MVWWEFPKAVEETFSGGVPPWFFNLTRKSEWHLGCWSHSQTDGSPDKWRKKRWNQTQGKTPKSHAHSAVTYCLLSAQQKIKAYHFTFISSFLFHSLLSTSLHLESFVSLFFHFSVSPSGFTSPLRCSHTHSAPPPSVSHSASSLSVYHSLIQLASLVWFQSEAAVFTQWWLQKIWFKMNFTLPLSVLSCRNKCISSSLIEEKKDHRPGCWVTG